MGISWWLVLLLQAQRNQGAGNAAVRAGDWKLVRLGQEGPWELYDLKADRTEQHDLAAAQSERVRELAAKWDAWAERAQVKPYPAGDPGNTGAPKKKGKSKRDGGSSARMHEGAFTV
jgi:arylsulfatase A-like enzyme